MNTFSDSDEIWRVSYMVPSCMPLLPLPKKGTTPQFSAHMSVVAKRLDGSIRMPLGTEVGLGPDDIVHK